MNKKPQNNVFVTYPSYSGTIRVINIKSSMFLCKALPCVGAPSAAGTCKPQLALQQRQSHNGEVHYLRRFMALRSLTNK